MTKTHKKLKRNELKERNKDIQENYQESKNILIEFLKTQSIGNTLSRTIAVNMHKDWQQDLLYNN